MKVPFSWSAIVFLAGTALGCKSSVRETGLTEAVAISHVSLEGQITDWADLDIGLLSATLTVSCSDPKLGECLKRVIRAKIMPEATRARISFADVPLPVIRQLANPDLTDRRLEMSLAFQYAGAGPFFASQLRVWGWESKPGADFAYVVSTMRRYLTDLSFHKIVGGSKITLKLADDGQMPSDDWRSSDAKLTFIYNHQVTSNRLRGTTPGQQKASAQSSERERQNAAVWFSVPIQNLPSDKSNIVMPTVYAVYYDTTEMLYKPGVHSIHKVLAAGYGPLFDSERGLQIGYCGEFGASGRREIRQVAFDEERIEIMLTQIHESGTPAGHNCTAKSD